MSTRVLSVQKIIPESNIVVFSPHYDDVLFLLGGYIAELKKHGLLQEKKFYINLIFSRSNYLAGAGEKNFDNSPGRIRLATGTRMMEDQKCMDDMLGKFNYRYELIGENECFLRGKILADSEMEFPHGMYDDFDEEDHQIFGRMKKRIRDWARQPDTALIFPLAFKEHIDHFIVREAAIATARELGNSAKATFYFQEDKPYSGIASDIEIARIDNFIKEHLLEERPFRYDPEIMIDLAFKHYVSQVEEVYKTGIRQRGSVLKELLKADGPCDRIFVYHPEENR